MWFFINRTCLDLFFLKAPKEFSLNPIVSSPGSQLRCSSTDPGCELSLSFTTYQFEENLYRLQRTLLDASASDFGPIELFEPPNTSNVP